MNRLNKELRKHGIVWETDEMDMIKYDCPDAGEELLTISNGFIVTYYSSAVMSPMFRIYDLHFERLCECDVWRCDSDSIFASTRSWFPDSIKNPWNVQFCQLEDQLEAVKACFKGMVL